MNCETMTEMLSDRLKGLLDADAEHALAEHLSGCPACREEAAAVEQLWNRMGDLEEDVPSDRMRARFYASLSAYQEAEPTGLLRALRETFTRLWPRRPVYQLGLSLATLLIGLLLGTRLSPGSTAEIESLRGEMQQMGQAISLTLLEHQSASKRLRGVDWSQRTRPDDQVVSALLDAVRSDDSVNVRLAAVEALAPLLESPRVGRQLLEALPQQDAPMMQVTLGQLLLKSGVNGSEQAVQELIERDEVDDTVREFLSETLSDAMKNSG